MKQFSLLLITLCVLFSFRATAQPQDSTIAIPNGSFENWSNGSGYSVTVLFFPLSVYSSYTYPTGWNYPTYPVNQTVTYSGMNVNVNTNLPLLKVVLKSTVTLLFMPVMQIGAVEDVVTLNFISEHLLCRRAV